MKKGLKYFVSLVTALCVFGLIIAACFSVLSASNYVNTDGLGAAAIKTDASEGRFDGVCRGDNLTKTGSKLSWKGDALQDFADGDIPPYNDNVRTTKYLGEQYTVIVLVDFNDITIQHEDEWSNLIFGTENKSVKKYYDEVSSGKIQFLPAEDSYGDSDGIVRLKLDRNHPNFGEC